MPLAGIEPEHVGGWISTLTEQGLSPSRTRQAYHLFSAILDSAVRSRYLTASPCVGIHLPRLVQREMRFLGPEDVERLAEATEERYRPLIYLLAYGGLRWGEAAALRRGRCDLLRSRVHVTESLVDVNGRLILGETKTHASRTVRLPGERT